MITSKCLVCGSEIIDEHERKICSRKCQSINMSRKNNKFFKGGTSIYTNGKKRIKSKSYEYILGGKKKTVHRHIAELAIGRKLKRNEHVHHINGNTLDNRNENLLLCSSSYHIWIHNRMSQLYMEEHFGVK